MVRVALLFALLSLGIGGCSGDATVSPLDKNDGGDAQLPNTVDQLPNGKGRPVLLRAVGPHFVDQKGGKVILRGVNLAGTSKLPPFVPLKDGMDMSSIDAMRPWGINVIRLVVVWEAVEPEQGKYNTAYLDQMVEVAKAASARGIYVIIDSHQDGFSRFASGGCGSGFPRWALSPDATASAPKNDLTCIVFAIQFALDQATHKSFHDFYRNRTGVRDRYIAFMAELARRFSAVTGVIGYDLMNEPLGIEPDEVAPLYQDLAVAIRRVDPQAILFVEGVATTNTGSQTSLPKPKFGNFVYSPHFYDPTTLTSKVFVSETPTIATAFSNMYAKANDWNVPVFVGEYGAPDFLPGAGNYVSLLWKKFDIRFASGAQWNYSPRWTPDALDNWNHEDFSIINDQGQLRSNFYPRPYPQHVAGEPRNFFLDPPTVLNPGVTMGFEWENRPIAGETVIYVPKKETFGDRKVDIEAHGIDLICKWTADNLYVTCRSSEEGRMTVRLVGR